MAYTKSGTDLSTIFDPIGGATKRADVNYDVGGVDISNSYWPLTISGTSPANTNFQAGGSDLASYFAAIGTSYLNRGLFLNGEYTLRIDFIGISTTGNARDFGDLIYSGSYGQAALSNGSNNRGITGKCYNNSYGGWANVSLEYVTISTLGNASDFGDSSYGSGDGTGISNGTGNIGIFAGGVDNIGGFNNIEYKNIASTGNFSDFGNLIGVNSSMGGCSNGTSNRGLFAGGSYDSISIQYITINSAGNATDNYDLTVSRGSLAGTSNGTSNRGIWGGGSTGTGTFTSTIDYRTITTNSNASYFGALTVSRYSLGGTSSGTGNRGVFGGGAISSPSKVNTIDYVTISSGGSASDFGDLVAERTHVDACSNG